MPKRGDAVHAALFRHIGDEKLEVRDDVTTIDPGPGEVRIRIKAAGICHSDISAIDGTLPALAPGIAGHEGAGVITDVGDRVTALAPGDHVMVTLIPPCGSCSHCNRGQPNLCQVHALAAFSQPRFRLGDEGVFGFTGCGTFAEELVVPQEGAVKIPDDVPFEIAALVGCGALTGIGAVINTARVEPGSTVVVIGAGGVGISVIQGAQVSGAAEIVAIDPVPEKHAQARRFGATHAGTPEELPELIQSLTGGEGFDYAFEVVGLGSTIRTAYDAARRGGTAVIVGAGSEHETIQLNAQELFIDEKRLLGSFYGSVDVRRDPGRILALWRGGRVDLESMISRRIPLSQINEGIRALQQGSSLIRQIVTFD
jgi:S-(hydroxymethyl)glutathione dehydrogenase/alcohol dehydrogenase